MSKKKSKAKNTTTPTAASEIQFSFGEAEPIVNGWRDLLHTAYDPFRNVYQPPILPAGLAKVGNANATHGRCISFKVGQMGIVFVDNGVMPLRDFMRAARDLETFGNCYLQGVFNMFGMLIGLRHVPALNMRKMKNGRFKLLMPFGQTDIEFKPGEIFHAYHYDAQQSIYGLPTWIGALNDALLNSEATLFRRRYYLNGSHMGYILYTSDPAMDKEIEEKIREKVEKGKGAGNFRSMYINIPNGKDKAVQILPVGDISQKDEFANIKNISADDILVGHGMQASLAGVKPDNTGGFGDIEKIERFYRRNEVPSLVRPFEELNEQLARVGKLRFEFDFMRGLDAQNDC